MNQWTWNDGWILMSIYMVQSTNSIELSDVIGAADASNHAIPTPKELSHAFTKLSNAGVIKIEEGNYKITPKHFEGVEAAYNTKGGLFESGRKGEEWLKRSHLAALDDSSITVSEEKLEQAYNIYISRIKK